MYKIFDGKNWINFDNYIELVNWLSKFNVHRGFRGEYNSFLRRVGNTDKDCYRHEEFIRNGKYFTIGTRVYSCYDKIVEYNQRDCRIVNEDGISVYDHNLINDVMRHEYDEKIFKAWAKKRASKQKKRVNRFIIPDSAYPVFRRGPVPYTGCHHGYHGFRRISTMNEIRQTCNPESEPFNRASRAYNLPTSWDDIDRDWRDSGWKSQGKNKHQWEHNVKEKIKHKMGKCTFVVKGYNKRNYGLEIDIDEVEEFADNTD